MIGSESRLRRFHSFALADRHAAIVPAFKRALDLSQQLDMPALKTQWFGRPGQRDVLQAVALRYGPWVGALLLSLAGLWLWHSRRLHAEVRRTRAAQTLAEASGAATRRFTTFLAHEVRNSLHAVIAGTELAHWPGHAGPQVNAMLADSARSTLHLLNNLIDRERLHAGRLVLRPEPARLTPLLQAVVDEMAPAAVVRGLDLRMLPADMATPEPFLLLDWLRLQQVLRNLLSNAIKYSDTGAVEVQVQVRLLPHAVSAVSGDEGSRVELEVRDRGRGIPEGELAALFEPFNAAPGIASSAGLGLPLCRDLAQLMGGTLAILAREGGGTVARLRFPAHRAEPAPARPPQSLRVLVVEDAEVYGLLLVRALELRGHRAEAQTSLAAARQAVQRGSFDLVLTDINLPDGDAGALLQWLQDAAPEPKPRVAVMTADLETAPSRLLALLQGHLLLEKTDDVRDLVERALRVLEAAAAPAPV